MDEDYKIIKVTFRTNISERDIRRHLANLASTVKMDEMSDCVYISVENIEDVT